VPLIRELLMGYMCIADNGFLHRDLKPANILLKDRTVKIADFGFAKRATSNPKETVNVGSPLYMSPEALQGNVYTAKNDIWSLGVILYEMLHGKAPWACTNEKQLIEEISKGSVSLLKGLSEDLKDFIRRCLVSEEGKRMSPRELGSHPFVARIVTDAIPALKRAVSAN
jgi:calcium-dependent protein kinase